MRARTGRLTGLVLAVSTVTAGTHALPLPAQGRSPTATRLTGLDCTFTVSATAVWTAPEPQIRLRRDPRLEFRITNIDNARGAADVMLGALTVPTVMAVDGTTVHFIQPPDGGETAITSVIVADGAREFRATYSRTSYYAYTGPGFTSTPQAEQYYGYCVQRRD